MPERLRDFTARRCINPLYLTLPCAISIYAELQLAVLDCQWSSRNVPVPAADSRSLSWLNVSLLYSCRNLCLISWTRTLSLLATPLAATAVTATMAVPGCAVWGGQWGSYYCNWGPEHDTMVPCKGKGKDKVKVKVKVKATWIYIAPCRETSKALRHGSHSFTCKLHHACLYLVSFRQMALPLTCDSVRLTAVYDSSIDPERMKGWVVLVGWPVADCLPI